MFVEYGYAQARAQAQHGARLSKDHWRLVGSSHGLAHYLHTMRSTSLAPRVQHFSPTSSPHAIERSLRRDWRIDVANASNWVPQAWRAAVRWFAWLPDLPAIKYLADGRPVFPWMREDPVLAEFAADDVEARRTAIVAAGLGAVVATNELKSPYDLWLQHWLSLWPETDRIARRVLDELLRSLHRYRQALGDESSRNARNRELRGQLERRVCTILRTRARQPATVFCHLILSALEYQRLRDGLIRRAVFNDLAEGASP